MGRYYTGDIEGKFAFAIQPSTAPETYLGAEAVSIEYSWSGRDDIKSIIDQIKQKMRHKYDQIEKYFSEHSSYTDKELAEYMHITEDELHEALLDYYNYKLGKKVYDHMVENDTEYCSITAEL